MQLASELVCPSQHGTFPRDMPFKAIRVVRSYHLGVVMLVERSHVYRNVSSLRYTLYSRANSTQAKIEMMKKKKI